jgi:hypothetical protein
MAQRILPLIESKPLAPRAATARSRGDAARLRLMRAALRHFAAYGSAARRCA